MSRPPLTGLKHLASLHNPDFYEQEKLRFSTWNIPRFIRCYRETIDQLLLPRGLLEKAARLVADAGSRLDVYSDLSSGEQIDIHLRATLRPEQRAAADALAGHDLGTLVAPPGSGKTVVGCALIAQHQVAALVIVDRKPLVEQWRDRLVTHLDLTPRQVGQLGGSGSKATGVVDVAMVQTLARRGDLAQLATGYGLVIVDECHHVPAVTFERAVRELPVRRWVGLTATPYRRDGLQAMMAMHCGPVRHTMTPSAARPFEPSALSSTRQPTKRPRLSISRQRSEGWSRMTTAPRLSATTSPLPQGRGGTASFSHAGLNTSSRSQRGSPTVASRCWSCTARWARRLAAPSLSP